MTNESSSFTGSTTQIQCFKTRLCHFYLQQRCTRGGQCLFAHSDCEVRFPPDLSKTKLCVKWKKGCCRHGSHCTYAHGVEELRPLLTDSPSSPLQDDAICQDQEDISLFTTSETDVKDEPSDADTPWPPVSSTPGPNLSQDTDWTSHRNKDGQYQMSLGRSNAGKIRGKRIVSGKTDEDFQNRLKLETSNGHKSSYPNAVDDIRAHQPMEPTGEYKGGNDVDVAETSFVGKTTRNEKSSNFEKNDSSSSKAMEHYVKQNGRSVESFVGYDATEVSQQREHTNPSEWIQSRAVDKNAGMQSELANASNSSDVDFGTYGESNCQNWNSCSIMQQSHNNYMDAIGYRNPSYCSVIKDTYSTSAVLSLNNMNTSFDNSVNVQKTDSSLLLLKECSDEHTGVTYADHQFVKEEVKIEGYQNKNICRAPYSQAAIGGNSKKAGLGSPTWSNVDSSIVNATVYKGNVNPAKQALPHHRQPLHNAWRTISSIKTSTNNSDDKMRSDLPYVPHSSINVLSVEQHPVPFFVPPPPPPDDAVTSTFNSFANGIQQFQPHQNSKVFQGTMNQLCMPFGAFQCGKQPFLIPACPPVPSARSSMHSQLYSPVPSDFDRNTSVVRSVNGSGGHCSWTEVTPGIENSRSAAHGIRASTTDHPAEGMDVPSSLQPIDNFIKTPRSTATSAACDSIVSTASNWQPIPFIQPAKSDQNEFSDGDDSSKIGGGADDMTNEDYESESEEDYGFSDMTEEYDSDYDDDISHDNIETETHRNAIAGSITLRNINNKNSQSNNNRFADLKNTIEVNSSSVKGQVGAHKNIKLIPIVAGKTESYHPGVSGGNTKSSSRFLIPGSATKDDRTNFIQSSPPQLTPSTIAPTSCMSSPVFFTAGASPSTVYPSLRPFTTSKIDNYNFTDTTSIYNNKNIRDAMDSTANVGSIDNPITGKEGVQCYSSQHLPTQTAVGLLNQLEDPQSCVPNMQISSFTSFVGLNNQYCMPDSRTVCPPSSIVTGHPKGLQSNQRSQWAPLTTTANNHILTDINTVNQHNRYSSAPIYPIHHCTPAISKTEVRSFGEVATVGSSYLDVITVLKYSPEELMRTMPTHYED